MIRNLRHVGWIGFCMILASIAATLAITYFIHEPTNDCSGETPMHTAMARSSLSQLRRVSQYEQICRGGIIDKASFFTTLPTTAARAITLADDVSTILKEYARAGISPLILLEPTNDAGLVNLGELSSGSYDEALDAYFSHLKALGISDTMMGTWAPIPEGNLLEWSSSSPVDFSASVTKIASLQKKYFPASKSTILLDTKSHPSTGDGLESQTVSLLPYLKGIPKGLLDSIGLQGFPWEPPADTTQANNGTPSEYLRADLLIEAAQSAGVHDVWVNSGTFSTIYSNQGAKQVTKTPEQRRALLNGVISQLEILQKAGLSPSMHLFAEDKSQQAEVTNWSYLDNGQSPTTETVDVFKSFTHDLQLRHIPLWLFDAQQ